MLFGPIQNHFVNKLRDQLKENGANCCLIAFFVVAALITTWFFFKD